MLGLRLLRFIMLTVVKEANSKVKISARTKTLVGFFAAIFLILTITYFRLGSYDNWPYKIESDGKYYYQFLVSLVYDHDIDFTNNYLAPRYPWMVVPVDHYNLRNEINPVTHHPLNYWTIGPAILWFPFYLVTWVSGSLMNLLFHSQLDLNPWGLLMQYGTMFAAVVYTLLALWLIYLILKDYFKLYSILSALALLLFASNLLYYSSMEVSLSHVYDFFSLVLFLFCFKRVTSNPNNSFYFISLGAAAGLHTLVRTQNFLNIGIFALLLAYLLWLDKKTGWKRPVLNFLLFGGVYLFSCLPLFLSNKYLFGNPLTLPQGSGFLTSPHLLEILFSTRNGLFLYNPALFLGFWGFLWLLWRTWRSKRLEKLELLFLLGAFLTQVLVNSAAADWWGGDSFGQRRLVGCFFIFAIGLTYLFEKIATWKKLPKLVVNFFLWALIPLNLLLIYAVVHVWHYQLPTISG